MSCNPPGIKSKIKSVSIMKTVEEPSSMKLSFTLEELATPAKTREVLREVCKEMVNPWITLEPCALSPVEFSGTLYTFLDRLNAPIAGTIHIQG